MMAMNGQTIRQETDVVTRLFEALVAVCLPVEESRQAGQIVAEDQLGRFRIWAGNIGVRAKDHASLDYRLRDSQEARELMLELLGALESHVKRAIDINRSAGNGGLFSLPASEQVNDSEDAYGSVPSSAISSAFLGTETESLLEIIELPPFDQQMRAIEQSIDRLYRLSVAIRRPSLLSQDRAAAKFVMRDEEGNQNEAEFKSYALKRLTMELTAASATILGRLSEAVTFRRRRFLYRSRHQVKLGAGAFMAAVNPEASVVQSSANDKTTIRLWNRQSDAMTHLRVSSKQARQFSSHASATSASEFQKSQFRAAPVFETVSAVSTTFPTSSDQRYALPIPDAPPFNPGSKEIQCPYCCLMIRIEEAQGSKWRRHVLNDLEPYICLFENCGEGHTMYRDKSAWTAHMQAKHTIQWSCTAAGHPPMIMNTEEAYEKHMFTTHAEAFAKEQLPWLKKQSQGPSSIVFTSCILCEYLPSETDLQRESVLRGIGMIRPHDRARLASSWLAKHTAFHLERISLIALPWQDAFKQTGKSERSASSLVEQDSLDNDTEDTKLDFDNAENDKLRYEAIRTWSQQTLSKEEVLHVDDEAVGQPEWGFLNESEYFGHARDPILQTFLRKWYLGAAPVSYGRAGILLPAYMMPSNPSSNFFGREHELRSIEAALLPNAPPIFADAKPITFPRTFAIHASGGMGKTQIATQFITRHCDKFDAVFWIYADDHTKLSRDFKNIAIKLGLVAEDSVDSRDLVHTRNIVKKWLINPVRDLKDIKAENPERATWLLIFDGVEDPKILNECWPYDGPGSVLITSRSPFSWTSSIQLKPFSSNEATDFLMSLSGKDASLEERTAMNNVGYRLGGLPLALAQMAGTIQHKQLSFAEFLRSYSERYSQGELLRLSEIDPVVNPSGYEHTIASVWAFDNLVHGTEMLNIASMLDPDGVPENIFTAPLRDTSLQLWPPTWTEFSAARHELVACSLLSRNKAENKFFIHRLVQDVARARMTKVEFRGYFMTCVKLISSLWPFETFDWRHSVARWTPCERLFPHVARLKDLFPQVARADVFSDDDYLFAKLLTDAGWYHHERGRSLEADILHNSAQTICESLKHRLFVDPGPASMHAPRHKQIDIILAEIQHNRTCIATEINEPENALMFGRRFNDMMVKELGHVQGGHDMRLAISWNELGNAYMLINKWQRGQECFERSITLMKQLENFRDTWISLPMVNLGLSHWLQDRYDEALKTLSKGLKDREHAFGLDDRISFITGRFLHAIGNVKADQGKLEESQTFHHRALLHYKSTLGNNHHRTADTLIKVAEHHIRQGQGEIALALIDHSLKIYSSSTNNTYTPEKTRASFLRSNALRVLGRVEDAATELQNCFDIYRSLVSIDSNSERFVRLTIDESPCTERPKTRPEDLRDRDLNNLITFWSK